MADQPLPVMTRIRNRVVFRTQIAGNYGVTPFRRPFTLIRFVCFDREATNFTYDLENEDAIAPWVAEALGRSVAEIDGYLAEVRNDSELRAALAARMKPHPFLNNVPRFGRRLGWYCALRATKPKLAVETGTADGLGTALLARGLERNAAEGSPGRLLSFDLDSKAGFLLDELQYREFLVVGDSNETLPRTLAGSQIDFFVHDSDHSAEHERMELEFALAHAAPRLVLISDNAHVTTELSDVCKRIGTAYHFFRERPRHHFYPGAGIGLTVVER